MIDPARLLEATDPQTPIEKLEALAKNPAYSSAVAQNPNTPKALLLQLALKHPDEVLQNASFALYLLEDPSLFSSCSAETLKSFLRSPHFPENLLHAKIDECKRAMARYGVLLFSEVPNMYEIAQNTKCSVEFLEMLCLVSSPDIKRAAFDNPNTPKRYTTALQGLGIKPTLITHAETFDPSLPGEEIEFIYQKKYQDLEILCARHSSTPEHILRELYPKHAVTVLQNPAAPKDLLLAALQNNALEVLTKAALQNPSCPAPMLEQFATHFNFWYRVSVASNPSTPAEHLGALVKDKERSVRRALTTNPSTPLPALLLLAKDSLVLVRRELAARRPMEPEVLNVLSKDKDSKLRARLTRNSSTKKTKRG